MESEIKEKRAQIVKLKKSPALAGCFLARYDGDFDSIEKILFASAAEVYGCILAIVRQRKDYDQHKIDRYVDLLLDKRRLNPSEAYFLCLNFPQLKGFKELQAIACMNGRYAYEFASNIGGADIEYCRAHMSDSQKEQFDKELMLEVLK